MSTFEAIAEEAVQELRRAKMLHPGVFASAHEGYAVLLEEVDELWDAVKTNPRNLEGGAQEWRTRMRSEAIQIAAMAMRFVDDVCERKT